METNYCQICEHNQNSRRWCVLKNRRVRRKSTCPKFKLSPVKRANMLRARSITLRARMRRLYELKQEDR